MLLEAFLAQVVQDGPGARHRAAALAGCDGGVDQRVTGSIGAGEKLVFADVLVPVHDARSALGGVAVLVQVGRDGGHARHAEIEIGQVVAQLAHEREMDAAHAAIHVEEQALLLGQRADLGNRVDHALRVAWCRSHQQNRVFGDGRSHGIRFHLESGRVDVHHHRRQAQVMRRLVERGVRCLGQYHFGPDDLWMQRPRPVSGGLHGQHNAFGAARCHVADHILVATQQGGQHAHHVGFQFQHRREYRWVEPVLAQVRHVCLLDHVAGVFARAVNVAPDLARFPIHIMGFESL